MATSAGAAETSANFPMPPRHSPVRSELVARKVVGALPRVSVDYAEGRFLSRKIGKQPRQKRMLKHIREIAGMKCMAVIHVQ